MAKTLNEIVQKCRWDAGLTITEVAELTGYSRSYICLIEIGERRCPEPYWKFWSICGNIKAEDYRAYPNMPEDYYGAKI